MPGTALAGLNLLVVEADDGRVPGRKGAFGQAWISEVCCNSASSLPCDMKPFWLMISAATPTACGLAMDVPCW